MQVAVLIPGVFELSFYHSSEHAVKKDGVEDCHSHMAQG